MRMVGILLAASAALLVALPGCGRKPARIRPVRLNRKVTGYGPVAGTAGPVDPRATANRKAELALREAEQMMSRLEYARARKTLRRVNKLGCSAELKARASAATGRCELFRTVLASFPRRGSARERIGRFLTVDRTKIEGVVEKVDEEAYHLRVSKRARVTLAKDALLKAQILSGLQLDAYYAAQLEQRRAGTAGSAAELVAAARRAYSYGLLEQVNALLAAAYALDPDLEVHAIR